MTKTNNTKAQTDGPEAKRTGTIQSISIAMRFLECLSASDKPLTLAELSQQTQTGRSTAHRYMQSLVKEGLAKQDPATSHYDLGFASLQLGTAALRRVDAVEIAGAQMKQLAENHSMTAGVAIWTERGPTVVRWYRSAYFSINSVGLGDVLPVDNSASGLLAQAFLPKNKIEKAREHQPAEFRGSPAARAKIEQIRRENWAELTSHLYADVTGQAAPVLDAQGDLVCLVTSVTNVGQLRHDGDRFILQDAARLINRATGGISFLD